MLPPLAVEVSASVEIAAPLFINKRTAETVIEPASPLPVDRAVICGPGSGRIMSEATVTLTSPPLPGPAVERAICAPPSTVRRWAVPVTDPPGPGPEWGVGIGPPLALDQLPAVTVSRSRFPRASVWAVIPLRKFVSADVPSIVKLPATVTETLPPDPVVNVPLEISPLLTID